MATPREDLHTFYEIIHLFSLPKLFEGLLIKKLFITMHQINKDEIKYLAGLIDGDGCISAQCKHNKSFAANRPYQIQVTLQITQDVKTKHVLEKAKKDLGVGNITMRKESNGSTICDLKTTAMDKVKDCLIQLRPHLRGKKKQANLVLRIIEQHKEALKDINKFVNLLRLIERVQSLNAATGPRIDFKQVFENLKSLNKLPYEWEDVPVPVETDDDETST